MPDPTPAETLFPAITAGAAPVCGTRRAVVEVGTNSVKLLVADVCGSSISPILERSVQTRLGEGLYAQRHLQPEPMQRTARTVASMVAEAREAGAGDTRAIATSAAREATNAGELQTLVRTQAGIELNIISGDLEAHWAARGVGSHHRPGDGAVLIVDVGGGSTEFVLVTSSSTPFRHSHPLGAVRLLQQIHPSDPPAPHELAQARQTVRDFLLARVMPDLAQALAAPEIHKVRLVACGGTATVLAAMEMALTEFNRERIDGFTLTARRLHDRLTELWQLPLCVRRELPGLPPGRADVILTGSLVFAEVLDACRLPSLEISTRGVRYGAILD